MRLEAYVLDAKDYTRHKITAGRSRKINTF